MDVYDDAKPCEVCGSPVRLRPRTPDQPPADEPVGPAEGFVGGGDLTVDERVCTNDDCPTNTGR